MSIEQFGLTWTDIDLFSKMLIITSAGMWYNIYRTWKANRSRRYVN